MLKVISLTILISAAINVIPASADSCSSGPDPKNAAAKVLARQLSALRSIARARGCREGQTGGGLFNACREIALKISEVQQELGATTGATKPVCRSERAPSKPIARSLPANTTKIPVSKSQAADKQSSTRKMPRLENALQFCVRRSDGYYFPTPNSQFGPKGGASRALTQCRLICGTDDMEVYVLNDANTETANMVSMETGRLYAELSTAYNYHGEGEFKRCDWNGYINTIISSRAPRSSARTTKVERHTTSAVSTIHKVVTSPINSERLAREIRKVGPVFITDTKPNVSFDERAQ